MAIAVAPAELTEVELAAALACDLDAAFEPFVIAYRQCIVTFVARMLGDNARAEDVAQDVFVRAYNALRSYSAERAPRCDCARGRMRSRITSRAMRCAMRRLRSDSLEFEDGAERAAATIDPQPGPELLAARRETWHEIQVAIGRLSPRIRPAYVMRYLDDLSYEEIARALEQPIGTVKASAHRAALAVRSHLENDYV